MAYQQSTLDKLVEENEALKRRVKMIRCGRLVGGVVFFAGFLIMWLL